MSHDSRRWLGKPWVIVLAVALLARAGFGTAQLTRSEDPSALEFPDEVQYWHMAQSLRAGEGLRDELGFHATRMPLFPAALSLFAGTPRGVVAAKATGWLIGAFVAVLAGGLATAIFDRRVGFCTGLLVAIDPFLVFSSSLLLTETLFTAALIALWWTLWRVVGNGECGMVNAEESPRSAFRIPHSAFRIPDSYKRWLAVGVVAALSIYVRESGAGLVVVALGFVVIARRLDPRALIGAIVAGAVITASLLPWAARNHRVTGDWCWLTHRVGISLYDGVGPQATGASDLGDIKQMPAVATLDEVEWNRYFLSESIRAIKSDPGRIIRLAGIKLTRLWNLVPNIETYRSGRVRILAAAWTLPTFALAAAGVILWVARKKRDGLRSVLFLLLPALYLTAVHSLFVGSVRYRLPAIPMIEMLAAVAVVAIVDAAGKRRSTRDTARAH